MILTGRDIQQYINAGSLSFTPVLEPAQFQQNGVDMILAEAEKHFLGRGDFTLGSTREWVKMPNDLMAFVQLRSTFARKGIMLPPTIIDAGFSGAITLEIASFADIELPIGQRFDHVVFAKLSNPTQPYNGKYQYQRGITAAKDDL